ncbi:phage tail sheath family protein, partial [Chryseobacterium sp.]|uniref:phage tail sheath family protein n=2 Tax=Chryseobacterium TaxID=59732 RepID=UPI001B127352
MNYKTPGVYVEELAKFPPSVAQVETAIPAFIGYTEKGPKNEPTRISSLLEYETLFGGAKNESFTFTVVEATTTPPIKPRTVTANLTPSPFKMYYALQMYFANGGGPCYIVSVAADYPSTGVKLADLTAGLKTLEKEDEPTLIVFPDAEGLASENDAYQLYNLALDQAEDLKDRFVIMDVLGNVSAFRTAGPSSGPSGERLKYGAAYYPKLETVLTYGYDSKVVEVSGETLEYWKTKDSELYNLAKAAIESKKVVMAPSSSMAGVYAKVDSTSGVFKAPANIGLNYVVAPTVKISHEDQENLNVDATAGKSINAIRTFT